VEEAYYSAGSYCPLCHVNLLIDLLLPSFAACVVYTLHWQFAERMMDRRPNERP
jgi:hypothetical protein